MTRARLNRIEVTGFRSFGQSSQGFDMPATVSVLWGGNSQGKTSLAEAVEFLFSGQIVRRELLASAKDEFAEALRNAHIGGQIPTRVDADVLCSDGRVRRLSRTMTEDYRRGSAAGCVSTLTIDGNTCVESDIQDVLGVTLSHAPLVAPVLTQHTLAYIFSAPPAERSTYFRALLDTQDLEDFRLAVSKLADAIPAPKLDFIEKLASFEAIDALKEPCGKLRKAKSKADIEKHLIACLAVLSQSQLHCLGLSLFLARAAKEGVGFVLLDDPVLTSDDDYRPNFASSVIEGLLNAGIQVIVATQDHGTWKDIGHRWSHREASLLQLVRNDPVEGTEVRNQSDDLATMIAKAQPYTKSQDPIQRKEGASLVRLAIERFGKMILVKSRKANGDNLASITDYDGQNFGNYSGQVQLLLTADPSHPGKITAAHNYVTPAAHDDTPPSAGQLKMAYGDLKALKRAYLDN